MEIMFDNATQLSIIRGFMRQPATEYEWKSAVGLVHWTNIEDGHLARIIEWLKAQHKWATEQHGKIRDYTRPESYDIAWWKATTGYYISLAIKEQERRVDRMRKLHDAAADKPLRALFIVEVLGNLVVTVKGTDVVLASNLDAASKFTSDEVKQVVKAVGDALRSSGIEASIKIIKVC